MVFGIARVLRAWWARATQPEVQQASADVPPERLPPTEFQLDHDPRAVTLAFAQEWLAARMDAGVPCPCCTQFTKVYARTITATMAYALVCLYRHAASGGPEWFHAPSYLSRVARLADSTARGGDWAKLTAWGLIEESTERREDDCPHTGYYRVTEAGRAFVLGQITVPRWAIFYAGRVLRLDDRKRVSIQQALGKRFNYAELMATSPTSPE